MRIFGDESGLVKKTGESFLFLELMESVGWEVVEIGEKD